MKYINQDKFKNYFLSIMLFVYSLPINAMADEANPFSKASNHMEAILFGTLGTSISAIFVGATFIMAKVGKISWDRFVFTGFCVAGFLGAPSIVALIKSWVG